MGEQPIIPKKTFLDGLKEDRNTLKKKVEQMDKVIKQLEGNKTIQLLIEDIAAIGAQK